MPNNNPTPFCPTTFAVRSSQGLGLLARAAGATYADLNFYIANASDPGYANVGDYLYVPAFQLVEREEPGELVEPKVGFNWTYQGTTRVIVGIEGDSIRYASNGVSGWGVFKATIGVLVAVHGYPSNPGRKIREWQPINRVSGP